MFSSHLSRENCIDINANIDSLKEKSLLFFENYQLLNPIDFKESEKGKKIESMIIDRVEKEEKEFNRTGNIENIVPEGRVILSDKELSVFYPNFDSYCGLVYKDLNDFSNSKIDLSVMLSFYTKMIQIVDDFIDEEIDEGLDIVSVEKIANAYIDLSNMSLVNAVKSGIIGQDMIKDILHLRTIETIRLSHAHDESLSLSEIFFHKTVGTTMAKFALAISDSDSSKTEVLINSFDNIGKALQILDDVLDYDTDLNSVSEKYNYIIQTGISKEEGVNKVKEVLKNEKDKLEVTFGYPPLSLLFFESMCDAIIFSLQKDIHFNEVLPNIFTKVTRENLGDYFFPSKQNGDKRIYMLW